MYLNCLPKTGEVVLRKVKKLKKRKDRKFIGSNAGESILSFYPADDEVSGEKEIRQIRPQRKKRGKAKQRNFCFSHRSSPIPDTDCKTHLKV